MNDIEKFQEIEDIVRNVWNGTYTQTQGYSIIYEIINPEQFKS